MFTSSLVRTTVWCEGVYTPIRHLNINILIVNIIVIFSYNIDVICKIQGCTKEFEDDDKGRGKPKHFPQIQSVQWSRFSDSPFGSRKHDSRIEKHSHPCSSQSVFMDPKSPIITILQPE